jgi:hypothetical protein
MTNLIVSRVCNQSCSYCFAGDGADRKEQDAFLSIEQFERRLDYLDRSGIEQARFLGGEPSLHPLFAELVERALQRGKTVIVFTNGVMPESAARTLETLPPERCSVVLNVSANGKAAAQRQKELAERLGPKVQPGCTLYRLDQDLESFLEWMAGTGCKPSVRVGLAHPSPGGSNAFLPTYLYRQAGERLLRFAEACALSGFKIELDCGFVRCMFTNEAIRRLQELSADLGWHCNPIIDIDLDGRAFHCFPLADRFPAIRLDEITRADDLRAEFLRQTGSYRAAGIYKQCATCTERQNQGCPGGCLAHVLTRFSSQPVSLKDDLKRIDPHSMRTAELQTSCFFYPCFLR